MLAISLAKPGLEKNKLRSDAILESTKINSDLDDA